MSTTTLDKEGIAKVCKIRCLRSLNLSLGGALPADDIHFSVYIQTKIAEAVGSAIADGIEYYHNAEKYNHRQNEEDMEHIALEALHEGYVVSWHKNSQDVISLNIKHHDFLSPTDVMSREQWDGLKRQYANRF